MKLNPDHVSFLTENAKGRTAKEIAAMFNIHFGLNLKTDAVRDSMAYRGIEWKKREMHHYSADEVAFLRKYAKGRTRMELTAMFNAAFGMNKNADAIKTMLDWHGISYGRHPHRHHAQVGSEQVKKNGYTFIKTAEPETWRLKHMVLWEAVNGLVPPGHMLIFMDRDKSNITLENLMLVTAGENAVMNRYGLRSDNPEYITASVTIANIRMKIYKRQGRFRHGKKIEKAAYDCFHGVRG